MNNPTLSQLQRKLTAVIETLPDSSIRSRLVWAYASLCRAEERRYRHDDFRKLRTGARTLAMKQLVAEPCKEHQTDAAYYFNNALFRMVVVAEIGLKQLFKRRESLDPPDDWNWIASWYERTYKARLTYLRVARKEINEWKHRERAEPSREDRRCETLRDGIRVFLELLHLVETLAEATST
jgi:hypothetical protein